MIIVIAVTLEGPYRLSRKPVPADNDKEVFSISAKKSADPVEITIEEMR
jgi:hypothetical protein